MRTPHSNILHKTLHDYWNYWLHLRNKDNKLFKHTFVTQYDDTFYGVNGIQNVQIQDIAFENKLYYNVLDENIWHYLEQSDDEKDEDFMVNQTLKKQYSNALDNYVIHQFFLAAKKLQTSDYYYILQCDVSYIKSRLSFHLPVINPPRTCFHLSVEDRTDPILFTKDWLLNFIDINHFQVDDILLIGTDGSVKDDFGGAAFFVCKADYYLLHCSYAELIKIKFQNGFNNFWNHLSQYCYRCFSIGIRYSIEFCAIYAILKALQFIKSYTTTVNSYVHRIVIICDNETCLNWLAGVNSTYDRHIYTLINQIFEVINQLFHQFHIYIYFIKVKAHNKEDINESADLLSKLAMYNYYQTIKWSKVQKIHGLEEWLYISFNSVKKSIKTIILKHLARRWQDYLHSRKNELYYWFDNLPQSIKIRLYHLRRNIFYFLEIF